MDSSAALLVVDDETDLRDSICDYLRLQGFSVTGCASGAEMFAALEQAPARLVLLDLNLPGEGGLSLAQKLRQRPDPPGVIMVTAMGSTVDRIVGLEMGADDYIAKPFELRELLARVRSVLRRVHPIASAAAPAPAAAAAPAARTLRFGGFSLDLDARRLLDPAAREIVLTAMEFDLLKVLVERPNRVLSRDQLLDLAHGKEIEPFDRSIDVRITRLRKKLGEDPLNPRLIRTVRGAGYMFVPDPP